MVISSLKKLNKGIAYPSISPREESIPPILKGRLIPLRGQHLGDKASGEAALAPVFCIEIADDREDHRPNKVDEEILHGVS